MTWLAAIFALCTIALPTACGSTPGDLRPLPQSGESPPPGRCDSRTAHRRPFDLGWEWRTLVDPVPVPEYVGDLLERERLIFVRRDGPNVRWTHDVGFAFPLADPISWNGHAVLLVSRSNRQVELRALDDASGRLVERETLTRGDAKVCARPLGDRLYVGVTSEEHLHVRSLDARFAWSDVVRLPGDWHDCDLARHEGRIVLAALRAREHTDHAGTLPSLELHVMSATGRLIRTVRRPYPPPVRTVRVLSAGDGLTVAWADFERPDYYVWELDHDARPRGEARRFATVIVAPHVDLANTDVGPALFWRTPNEEGAIPICHVPSAEEEARSALWRGPELY